MRALCALAAAVPFFLAACDTSAPAPELRPPAPVSPEIASAKPNPKAAPAPTSVENEPPAPTEPLAEPPSTDRRTLAHILEPKARVGAYLGLPDGWRNDDPSYLLFFPHEKNPQPPARAVAMTLVEAGVAEKNRARLLRRGGEPTGLRDATWGAWAPARVGRGRYEAVVARGRGQSVRSVEGPRSAIAVVVSIPDAPSLGFVGSWAAAEPQHEAAILDMLRAIERCQVEVGRGCVTADERKRPLL